MSNWYGQDDPRIDYERENGPPPDDEGRARYEFAKTAELAASLGGHPENADALERVLCIAAGLYDPPAPDARQKNLFNIAA